MISAPNGGCYWLVLPCPLHRWLRVCLVPAELRVSVWCQLGTDARDSLYLALNGRMLRARYTSPAFTMCRARVASQPGHGESSSVYRIRL